MILKTKNLICLFKPAVSIMMLIILLTPMIIPYINQSFTRCYVEKLINVEVVKENQIDHKYQARCDIRDSKTGERKEIEIQCQQAYQIPTDGDRIVIMDAGNNQTVLYQNGISVSLPLATIAFIIMIFGTQTEKLYRNEINEPNSQVF